jgi:hypothetical protein
MAEKISEERVKLKRAYESPASDDGTRVLVDRLWPRGLKKTDAAIDHWAKYSRRALSCENGSHTIPPAGKNSADAIRRRSASIAKSSTDCATWREKVRSPLSTRPMTRPTTMPSCSGRSC